MFCLSDTDTLASNKYIVVAQTFELRCLKLGMDTIAIALSKSFAPSDNKEMMSTTLD